MQAGFRCALVLGLGSLLVVPSLSSAQGGPATLAVEKIQPTPALKQAMDSAGKGQSLARVTDALDPQLMDRLSAGRKFRVVAVSDYAALLKELNRVSQTAETKQLNYGLVATLDDFEDSTERMAFPTLHQVGIKRKIRLSLVAKIYTTAIDPPEVFETANIQVLKKDDRTDSVDLQKNAELTDELLIASVREAAQKVADRVAEAAFPTKILARTGNQITINRGDSAGVTVGQVWNVFSLGKVLTDPDTQEVLGREELLAGKARVVSVEPKFSTAEIIEGGDKISEGMVLRLPQAQQ